MLIRLVRSELLGEGDGTDEEAGVKVAIEEPRIKLLSGDDVAIDEPRLELLEREVILIEVLNPELLGEEEGTVK